MLPPLHASTPLAADSLLFSVLLALAGLGAAGVLGLALAALVRRRSWSYLLVTLALAALLARTAVASISLAGILPVRTHHTLEHALDVVMAALVIAAVLVARTARRPALGDAEGDHGGGADD